MDEQSESQGVETDQEGAPADGQESGQDEGQGAGSEQSGGGESSEQ